jgi:hypothetical protein
MEHLKKFEQFEQTNESWRKIKTWLNLPVYLVDKVLSNLLGMFDKIGFLWDELSANIDTDRSLTMSTFKEDPIKLTIDDIENETMKKTLKVRGFFDKWNVYTFDRKSHDGRTPIYISKDELKKGDKYYGSRISDSDLNSEYKTKNMKRLLKKKGVSDISELEPQFYVIAKTHTIEHDKMKSEREFSFNSVKSTRLEKLVDRKIKEESFTGRTESIPGQWNNMPLVFKIIEADRVDLMKKLIKACLDVDGKEGVIEMLKQSVDSEGWSRDYEKYGKFDDIKTPLKSSKSEEMTNLIKSYLE